jgi:hypothetical protein
MLKIGCTSSLKKYFSLKKPPNFPPPFYLAHMIMEKTVQVNMRLLQNKKLIFTIVWPILGLLLCCSCEKWGKKTLFVLKKPSETGIQFANNIVEDARYNILDFEYVYNGGGVAIGDFNQDNKPDIFFSGNQVDNALYLNLGNFQFKDVSKTAGITAPGQWCSGAAVADVNGDGRDDIYVCANMDLVTEKRANLLYINQGLDQNGVPIFKNLAQTCGVADTGYSTHAAFFDYDKDQDLDLYVLTNEVEIFFPNQFRDKVNDGSAKNNDRLYRNDGLGADGLPHYTLVNQVAGIKMEGYGLGLAVNDINQDGWADIYVTNDYLSNDFLYLNQQNGTFKDYAKHFFKHTSHSAMGNDVGDLNNDGWADLYALDMLPYNNERKKQMISANAYQKYINNERYGYQFQYVRNTLQVNNGFRGLDTSAAAFSEVACLTGLQATDWSWSPLMVDVNNDGWRDLLITNGFPKDVSDQDFGMFRANTNLMRTSKMELLGMIPAVKIPNFAYQNLGGLHFQDMTADWGLNQASFSNGAAHADLDGDGDLDYVVNNINETAFVYENTLNQQKEKPHYLRLAFEGEKGNAKGFGAKVWVHAGGKTQYYEQTPIRGYLSSVEPVLHIGLGEIATIDSIRVVWPNDQTQVLKKIKADQVFTLKQNQAKGTYIYVVSVEKPLLENLSTGLGLNPDTKEIDFIDFNVQRTLPRKFSQAGPALAVADVDGDADDDLYVGGSFEKPGTIWLQQDNGRFKPGAALPQPAYKQSEEQSALFFDADGDGDKDLYVAVGGYIFKSQQDFYQDRFYTNEGRGQFKLAPDALPKDISSTSSIKGCDYDRDGDIDLFIGARVLPRNYPLPASCKILKNVSGNKDQPRFEDVTAQIAPDLNKIGLISDALWTDVDQDGWMDLLLCGDWMPITLLKNKKGQLVKQEKTGVEAYSGWWNSLLGGDFDEDGDIDYIAGNFGENTLYKANEKEPIQVVAKDFDANGNLDPVLFHYNFGADGKRRPYVLHSRDDLIKQWLATRDRYPKYADFAKATRNDLFKPEELEGAYDAKVNYLKSAMIENLGKGRFRLKPLHQVAQMAPLQGMSCGDWNEDGHLDILASTNDFSPEVFGGRCDALNGLLLLGNGKGDFTAQSWQKSGVVVPGDGRACVRLVQRGTPARNLYIMSQNRGPLRVFAEQQTTNKLVKLSDNTSAWQYQGQNGKLRRVEYYLGQSYFSQSSSYWAIPKWNPVIEFFDSKGVKSTLDIKQKQ